MRNEVLVVMFVATMGMSLPAGAAPPTHLWAQRFGDASSQGGASVATDASGNVYLAGAFQGTVNLGGANLVSAGQDDIFLAKFNPSGVLQWGSRFGDSLSQVGLSVATDASGNVYLTGFFQGSVDFGGGGLFSSGGDDTFLAKFNSSGAHQWSLRFGDAADQDGESVATDAAGNAYLTGYFFGTVNFGGGILTSVGAQDAFLAKFNSSGVYQWSKRFGDASSQYASSVAVDASGNAYLAGFFLGTVNFGGGVLTSAGSWDCFLARFNSAGAHQWSQRYGDVSDQFAYSTTTDAAGNAYLAGMFIGTVNFGVGILTSSGGGDAFLAKFNSVGVNLWSQRYGDESLQFATAVGTDASANVYLAGSIQGATDFGGGGLASAGGLDAFVAKFSSAGVHRWSYRSGGMDDQRAASLATDASSDVYLTGNFYNTMDLGAGNLVSAGSTDIFLAKLSSLAPEPAITSVVDVRNDQGRRVRIQFSRSGLDAGGSSTPVTEYEAYRRKDTLPLQTDTFALAAHSRDQLLASGWDFAGSVPSHGDANYAIIAPTLTDSTIVLGQHYSVFAIRAATAQPLTYFDSPPDSGYSLDNLAPGVPTNFVYSTGALTWDQSKAEDFDYFTVYGSNTSSFGSATNIDYAVAPTMNVNASPYVYYFVTATDFSGNEGRPAVVNTLSGVDGTPKSYVLSISSYPNPFNPETTVRYTVPSKGHVAIDIYDASGARIVTLVDGERDAGAYTQAWNGKDDDGRTVSSGVYFARVTHGAGTKSYKMVLLK